MVQFKRFFVYPSTSETKLKDILGVKNLALCGFRESTYVALSHSLAEQKDTDWIPLPINTNVILCAPKGKKFWHLWYKSVYGTGAITIYGYDGSILSMPIEYKNWQITLISSAARTTSGNSSFENCSWAHKFLAILDVTAASGTPTLDVKFQTSDDQTKIGDLHFINQQIGSTAQIKFPQVTGVVTHVLQFDYYGTYLRANYTIGGTTPSLTFSLVVLGVIEV